MPAKNFKDTFEENPYVAVNPSGKFFHLLEKDDTSEIRILDIANALSHQCRFAGHLLPRITHYSVAEHSILVAQILKDMGATRRVQFYGLMHDASETYLADMAGPWKPHLQNYYELEAAVQDRIADKFRMPRELPKIVKEADWIALFIEAKQVVEPNEEKLAQWQEYDRWKELVQSHYMEVQCWQPSMACSVFLAQFADMYMNYEA